MTIGPKPWETLTYDYVEVHRNLDCPMYDECLSLADGWDSFTCVFCPMSKGLWRRRFDPYTFTTKDDHTPSLPSEEII